MAMLVGTTSISKKASLFVASGINLFASFDNLIIVVWGEAPIFKDLTLKAS